MPPELLQLLWMSPIVTAFVETAKGVFPGLAARGGLIKAVSLAAGIVLAGLYAASTRPPEAAWATLLAGAAWRGLLVGMAACGLYDVGRPVIDPVAAALARKAD